MRQIINKDEVAKGRRLIGSKWGFKRKRDGRYRSRLVALGYMQIPGIDFTDNFSPVVHDLTLWIVLIIWIILDLDIDQMDVETAFLEGVLDPSEYVYMSCPDSFHLAPNQCLEIRKGLYGLVQSAIIFFMRFSDHLNSDICGFSRCEADQCWFYKVDKINVANLL